MTLVRSASEQIRRFARIVIASAKLAYWIADARIAGMKANGSGAVRGKEKESAIHDK